MKTMLCEKGGRIEARGYSDDTFGLYGAIDFDHDDCASSTTREFIVRQPDGSGIVVRGCHGRAKHGCGWQLSVSPLDEDRPFDGDFTMRQDAHTMVVSFYVLPGTEVTLRRYRRRR